ncbi:uncharacterized protein LOC114380778 [Glycine soja]|uniref:PWWP domain-containing protein n=1 Tax=Glycine soja TaxID=3848 RepID=A0A445HFR6_GLYSO|nr:uncharacterized protein LOC114380778 [Glycine soja]RZB72429.1 hypothetical protein D0Y65_036622 [Glycine soja]
MAGNTGQIDLNSEAVLFDRQNGVVGVKSSVPNVISVGVSRAETLIGEPVGGGEVAVHDQKVFDVGGDRGVNSSVEVFNGCEKEGFDEEPELVGVGSGLEKVVDGGCDEKEEGVSCGMQKNEDEKSGIECSGGVLFDYGGVEPDGGLVIEFNDGFRSELGCENARDVAENGLLSFALNNVTQGGDNDAVECTQEVKNDGLVNLSAVVENDGKRNDADSLVTKDGMEDSRAIEVATYQLQDGIPCMEAVDVNAEESLHVKDLSRNCLELKPSCEPAFQVDANVDVMQNQTVVVDVSEGLFENIQNECHGFDLVVDLNSYKSMHKVGTYWGSVSSEMNFCVSDLVWGKVTGHPWWPGQIFDASAASEKAKKHLKEGCHLIAYFGDGTFAWNDVSMLKPFQTHFSQMEKLSNLENFHHAVDCALDEVSRRVEFSLSCHCMPEDVLSKIKTQVISNAGINNQSCRRNGGDRIMNAMSFEPMKLVNFVKSLAQSPLVESDRLDFVIARSQLSAFYCSKGYSQLPEFPVLGVLFENDMETLLMREKEQCDYQTHVSFLQQDHKHISGDSKWHGKKLKLLSDLMSEKGFCISNGEGTSEQEAKSVPQRRGRKRKTAFNTSEDYFHNSQNGRLTQLQYASTNDMRSQLCLAAKDPTGESCSSDMVHFFAEFRKFISHDYYASLDQEMSLERMNYDETGVTSTAALASMTPAMEPCSDSYWTDRIIQSIPKELSLTKYQNERVVFLPETLTEANPLSFKLQPSAETTTDLCFKQQDTDRNLGSESSKLVEHLDGSSKEDFCPTALTLKFTNFDSVPSTTDLNNIFGRFGPLIESKTELLERTNRARVVFQRRSDAETAFSSAGKYSIFGPSLVSYRLKILPRKPPQGTGKRGRKRRKETSSVDGTAV